MMKKEKLKTNVKRLSGFVLYLTIVLFMGCSDDKEHVHDYLMGSLFGFEKNVRSGNLNDNDNTTLYNLPLLFAPITEEEWCDNLVEEVAKICFSVDGKDVEEIQLPAT